MGDVRFPGDWFAGLRLRILRTLCPWLAVLSSLVCSCEGPRTDMPEPRATLDWAAWQTPGAEFRPWVRWWWPGNDVEPAEIARELSSLAEQGFGGVELQAFDAALDPGADEAELQKRRSVDTAAYFANVKEMLAKAHDAGLGVDMTFGSGWPTARTDIELSDSMQMLVWGEATVEGGGPRTVNIPPPVKPAFYEFSDMAAAFGEPMAEWLPGEAVLTAVLAARVTGGERAANPLVLDDVLVLDPASVQVLTDKVKAGSVTFEPGPGDWRVIAFYQMPDGQVPVLPALPSPAHVVDHLDADVVDAALEHWLGKRTGLNDLPDSGWRGLFVDSFELKNERLFTSDFLAEFEARRGYDLTPYLPAAVLPGADNNLFDGGGLRRKSPFSLGDDDERIRFDYAHTVSDLFIERFLEPAVERTGLLRIQAYGIDVDIIRSAALASIPEAEQLYAGGTELFLRLVSSGAHLSEAAAQLGAETAPSSERPDDSAPDVAAPGGTSAAGSSPVSAEAAGSSPVSAESLVWEQRTYMTTPAKIRAAVDKLLAAGVNHVVYHGFPYRKTEGYGETGWHPFCSPFSGGGTFSSNVGEASPFWPFMKQVNDYVARVQALMRQGEPANGILVYYPFLGASASLVRMENHDELFFNGHFPGEPGGNAPNPLFALVDGLFGEKEPPPSAVWLEQAWPALRSLDRAGHAWDFVSDDIARQGLGAAGCASHAEEEPGKGHCADSVGGAVLFLGRVGYRGIVLFHVPHMSPEVAERLASASDAGVPVIVVGEPPQRQPGFLDHEAGDARVKAAMTRVMAASTTVAISSAEDSGLALLQSGAVPHLPGFSGGEIRHQVRVSVQTPRIVPDHGGSETEAVPVITEESPPFALHALLFNPEPEPRTVSFQWPVGCTSGYWLDAWANQWWPAEATSKPSAALAALGSLVFVCNYAEPQAGEGPMEVLPPEADANAGGPATEQSSESPFIPYEIGPWHLIVEGPDVAGGVYDEMLTDLPDWRDVETLRYCSSVGTYTADFAIEPDAEVRYFLRAADVRGAAEVLVNGKRAPDLLVWPFEAEVTDLLVSGSNTFEIRLVPPLRNRLVGLGQAGNSDYPQFVTDPERLAPTGLVGTVELLTVPAGKR